MTSYTVVDRDWSLRLAADEGDGAQELSAGTTTAQNQARLNRLRDLALAEFPDGEWVNFGPDSSFREIELTCEHGAILLRSWHPVFEVDPRLVAASYGVTGVGEKSRDEFLAADDPAYIAKREAFDAICRGLQEL